MNIKATHLCNCGHVAWAHTSGVFEYSGSISTLEEVQKGSESNGCRWCRDSNRECKVFTLPNLDLVEYLAEKRGLV